MTATLSPHQFHRDGCTGEISWCGGGCDNLHERCYGCRRGPCQCQTYDEVVEHLKDGRVAAVRGNVCEGQSVRAWRVNEVDPPTSPVTSPYYDKYERRYRCSLNDLGRIFNQNREIWMSKRFLARLADDRNELERHPKAGPLITCLLVVLRLLHQEKFDADRAEYERLRSEHPGWFRS
ncbi:MAG: hypothetical protein AB7L09_02495 [Nitrospira sp.]